MPTGDYRTADGTSVPGVTTIINLLHKPALVRWAYNLGRDGKDMDAERDTAMDGGTYAHGLIESVLTGSTVEPPADERVREAGETALAHWQQWHDLADLEHVDVERQLVSEELRCGGCPDLVTRDGYGDLWIVDWKTQRGVKTKPYETHRIQLAAYGLLYEEVTGERIAGGVVVLLSSNPRARIGHRDFWMKADDLAEEREAFRCLRRLYDLEGKIRVK